VVKAQKNAKEAEDRSKQSSLDPHLKERPKETFVPYSDSLFRDAAIEWLITTDQVSLVTFLFCFHELTLMHSLSKLSIIHSSKR
jgi:hypothetical protein